MAALGRESDDLFDRRVGPSCALEDPGDVVNAALAVEQVHRDSGAQVQQPVVGGLAVDGELQQQLAAAVEVDHTGEALQQSFQAVAVLPRQRSPGLGRVALVGLDPQVPALAWADARDLHADGFAAHEVAVRVKLPYGRHGTFRSYFFGSR